MQINSRVPIVLICDDGYVIPTCVAISSIISSKNTDTHYDIYIVCASLSEESEAGFLSLGSDTVSIHIVRENADRFSDMHVFVEGAMCVATTSALLKFILPELLSQHDKVLYLDGDILVRTDLSELYSIDLGDNLLAAAADSSKLYSNRDLVVAIDHYFNAGVMLLNLRQMRLENTTEKLIQTKKESTDSSLMDQNIFNIVCEHRVKPLPIWYNFLAINLKRADANWSIDKLNTLYGTDFKTKEELFSSWKIVHFSSKDKPWKNPLVLFANDWFDVYRSLPESIPHTIPDFPSVLANNTTISFTSYPERIDCVPKVVECLNNQSIHPTRVVLYLAKEQFIRGTVDLPDELVKQAEENKVEIHWCDMDLKPHKKYYYAMQEYPDDLIITIDDDVYLPNNTIEELMVCWLHNPKAVSARRTHLITFDSNGKLLPYLDWIEEYNILLNTPSMQLIGTGCSGILYPPHLLPQGVFDVRGIMENALYADDLWLKAHAAMVNVPTASATKIPGLRIIEGSQDVALWKMNRVNKRNDEYLQKISCYIDKLYGGENILQKALYSSNVGINLTGQKPVINLVKHLRSSRPGDENALKLVEIGKAHLTARIDVKLYGDIADFEMKSVSDAAARVTVPSWFQSGGKGYQIETRQEEIDMSFNIKTYGKLDIHLKGRDIRGANGKRLPYWINYNVLTYNGVMEFAEAKYAWHDKPITISHEAKAGETVNLHIEWKPCKMEDPELPKRLKDTEKKLKASLSREASLKNSVSFRTGRVITWLPRKVRGGLRCLKEHGPVYTLKRICWHINSK